MKSYKQKTIQACLDLVYDYEHPHSKKGEFFYMGTCPLCKMYYYENEFECIGCILAEPNGSCGCCKFASYKKASRAYTKVARERTSTGNNVNLSEEVLVTFKTRANFFRKIIPILEELPNRKFTPSGWTYFKELNREW